MWWNKILNNVKIDKVILDSLKKPWLLFFGLIFFINSPFVFFDVIQHDDWNFDLEDYKDNILVHQVRLDRPLSGLLQVLIFKIWKFQSFQDFKLFRLFSIFTISIAATLVYFSLRKYSCKKASFIAVLAFVCLPGFSYIALLNLLTTASLAFLLSLVAGYIVCHKPLSSPKIILATFLLICSASIHQIMSLFILIPCLITIIFEEQHGRSKFTCFCMAALVATIGNIFNILISVLIIKPWLALKFGKIVFLPLIPTHSSNWDFTSIKNKVPEFFSDFIAFGARFSMFEHKIAGWVVLALIVAWFVYESISEKSPKISFSNFFYLMISNYNILITNY